MPSGIVLLDKPLGLSSNAALQRVRRLFGAAKAGHAGSLDPLATGMLPICLDEATKIAGEILSSRKRYRFAIALGTRTATGDVEGAVIEQAPVPPLDPEALEAALVGLRGPQRQVPPMYSALKRDGRPLYALARAGMTVEREARPIDIHELTLRQASAQRLELTVECSKGTYVRVLAEDIAGALGTCGHVVLLRREWVAPFEREPMHALDALEAADAETRSGLLLAADRPLGHLAAVRLDAAQADRVRHGQAVPVGHEASGKARLYDERGAFMGIGELAGGAVRPRRLLAAEAQPD
ncbi:MAG: tRNA pseudouridine(55) synthase TruB [Pseudomonadota bacterium]|jgi:tRNA pseudouridine55 synthase|nr:tRNA pseudouridine(55) synthase TruB [Pseudomonadota bacterium]